MADFFLVLDEVTKEPKCVIDQFENTVTDLGSSVDSTDPQNPVVTVTSSDGADTSFVVPIPAGATADGVITGGSVVGNDLVLTRSVGADVTIDVASLLDDTNTLTDLGSSVDSTDPQNLVVTVTSSDGADTSFTLPIPAGSTPSITNLGHSVGGADNTDLTVTSSDGNNTTVDMAAIIDNRFAALPVCT